MTNLPLTYGKFYVDQYTNISRSMFIHWSKEDMKSSVTYVKPNRVEVTGEWRKLHIKNLVICTIHQTVRVIKSRRMR